MTNVLLLTNLNNLDLEPAYFCSFEMVHRIGAVAARMSLEPPVVFNVLESQAGRFGSRLFNAMKGLMFEHKIIPSTSKITLAFAVAILEEGKEDDVTTRIENLLAKFEELEIVVATAKVPVVKELTHKQTDPVKPVQKWKPEAPPNLAPYSGDFDIKDRFEKDGKVKKMGDIGLRFLFDYTTEVNPWNAVNMWPQI